MEIEFGSKRVEQLVLDRKTAVRTLGPKVAAALERRIQQILAAPNERQLRAYRSLRVHKLQNRGGDYAIDIDQSWRLEVTFHENTVMLMEVSNHYGD